MKELRSEIEIQASAERVWQAPHRLLPASPNGTRSSAKQPETSGWGNGSKSTSSLPGPAAMTFRPTVLKAEPNRELRWLGHLLISGLFDGEHIFTIEPLGEGRVRFTQREVFTGLLVPLFARGLDTDTRRGFEEMNQALKDKGRAGRLMAADRSVITCP